jgi:hypothetical protein
MFDTADKRSSNRQSGSPLPAEFGECALKSDRSTITAHEHRSFRPGQQGVLFVERDGAFPVPLSRGLPDEPYCAAISKARIDAAYRA